MNNFIIGVSYTASENKSDLEYLEDYSKIKQKSCIIRVNYLI